MEASTEEPRRFRDAAHASGQMPRQAAERKAFGSGMPGGIALMEGS